MKRPSIRNRTQLVILLVLVALLNLAEVSDTCRCLFDEDGELIPLIVRYCLRGSPAFKELKAGGAGEVRFSDAKCGDTPVTDALPVKVSYSGILQSVTTSPTGDGATVSYTVPASLASLETMKSQLEVDSSFGESPAGRIAFIRGSLASPAPLSEGGDAWHEVQALFDPETAPPWGRELLKYNGPAISTPRYVNFGTKKVSDVMYAFLNVLNRGDKPLVVYSCLIQGDQEGNFSIEGSLPGSYEPNGFRNARMQFRPKTLGSKTASLVITSNDPKYPTVTIPVQGTGIQ